MAGIQYFLGANTPMGFYSLYDQLIDRETARAVYILKGGPGCGKSTFLRRIGYCAEAAGFSTRSVLCSGDPNSLDALILPELHTALVDGTAPHVVEPLCPGAVDHCVDLGRYYDHAALSEKRGAISARSADNKEAYRRCYRYLAAAGALEEDTRALLAGDSALSRLNKRTKGILSRELKKKGLQPGKVTRRFLSALTCDGPMTLWDTVTAQCSRVYALCDSYGFAHEMLHPLSVFAVKQGHSVIACPSPMCPDRLEHLLIPSLDLAFVTSSKEQPFPGTPYRRVHLDPLFTSAPSYPEHRAQVRFSAKMARSLRTEAIRALVQAKEAHDALEQLYNPHVDFSAVHRAAEDLASLLFPRPVTANP